MIVSLRSFHASYWRTFFFLKKKLLKFFFFKIPILCSQTNMFTAGVDSTVESVKAAIFSPVFSFFIRPSPSFYDRSRKWWKGPRKENMNFIRFNDRFITIAIRYNDDSMPLLFCFFFFVLTIPPASAIPSGNRERFFIGGSTVDRRFEAIVPYFLL